MHIAYSIKRRHLSDLRVFPRKEDTCDRLAHVLVLSNQTSGVESVFSDDFAVCC